MTHWTVLPVVLPAMMAAIIVLVARHHQLLARILSVASTLALLALAIGLFWQASDGTISIYQLGAWKAPFGIVLVADRLATLMVLLTALLAVPVLLYAVGSGWDARGRHFHALFQFQLMGIMGAFLTGDAFNLFVFFEVLLIASYGLLIHGGGAQRLRAGTQYVLYNLLGSTLFLFALGTIYAETGTLNMADLAGRVAALDAGDSAGIRVASVLLLGVFAVKAALLPLHFWLPASYSEAPAPVAALFAIMTKVGAYGIIRFYTLVFPPDLEMTTGLFDIWLMPAALATLVLGMIGVLGARELGRLVAFSVIGSMGMLLAAVALFTPEGLSAALYYAVHSTFTAAVLFLLVDVVRDRRASAGALGSLSAPIRGGPLVAGMFFVGAIALCGLPPLSGFVGKLLVLDAAFESDLVWWIWAVILISSLIAIVGFGRAGSQIFWKAHQETDLQRETPMPEGEQYPAQTGALPLTSIGILIGYVVAITVFAGPLTRVTDATVAQLFAPAPYISKVLETEGRIIGKKAAYDDGVEKPAVKAAEGDH